MADAFHLLVKGYDEDMINCLLYKTPLMPLIEKAVISALDNELENLCSMKTKSVLRITNAKDLKTFTHKVIQKELCLSALCQAVPRQFHFSA